MIISIFFHRILRYLQYDNESVLWAKSVSFCYYRRLSCAAICNRLVTWKRDALFLSDITGAMVYAAVASVRQL